MGREAEKNVREFTAEQLAESNKIIGLQMVSFSTKKGKLLISFVNSFQPPSTGRMKFVWALLISTAY